MYFDPQSNPDFWKRAYVLKAALQDAGTILKPGMRRWLKRFALLALAVLLRLVLMR
jgi:hypothetical protein